MEGAPKDKGCGKGCYQLKDGNCDKNNILDKVNSFEKPRQLIYLFV